VLCRVLSLIVVLAASWLPAACGSSGSGDSGGRAVVRVPEDAATIAQALDKVSDGGIVLISPGTYQESVTVTTPGVTIRGADRNSVVVDGQGLRPTGIVVTAPGVTIQNLTVKSNTFYGVLVTGMPTAAEGQDGNGYATLDPDKSPPVQRFRIDHVTAENNGLYGIYAFDAQHGVIENSYASGSADSGIYVGQCRDCDVLVRGNVAERNAVGFENANASDSVYIVANRWSGNRVGLTLLSSYQEALRPQRQNVVVGNLITDNTAAQSPAQANGGYGIGVGISGGQDNTLRDNRIAGNPYAGVMLDNAEDIPASGNHIVDNTWGDNGADVADVSDAQTPSSGNCTSGGADVDVRPDALAQAVCPTGSARSAGIAASSLPRVTPPPGVAFLDVPGPRPQPNMTGDLDAPGDPLPDTVGPPDLSAIGVPAADYLAALAGPA
jgi:hypothetical protein